MNFWQMWCCHVYWAGFQAWAHQSPKCQYCCRHQVYCYVSILTIRISIKCYITFRHIHISSELLQHLFTINSFSLLSIMHAFKAIVQYFEKNTVMSVLENGSWSKTTLGSVQMLPNLCSICTKITDSGRYS